jgi:hypothetical protein
MFSFLSMLSPEKMACLALPSERRDHKPLNRLRSVAAAAAVIRHRRPAKTIRKND